MTDYKHKFSPPKLPIVRPPDIDSPEGQEAIAKHAARNYLRNNIGGGWHQNPETGDFFARLPIAIATKIVNFFKNQGISFKKSERDETHKTLSFSAEEVATLMKTTIDYGDSRKSLADQYADQLQGGHRR